MQPLRKTIVTILILLILFFVKRLLKEETASFTFYFNLLSCLQLFILGWCMFSLLCDNLIGRLILQKKWVWVGSITYIVLIFFAESICTYLLNHPAHIPSRLYPVFKQYYDQFDSRDIQYDPSFSQYNANLFYELKRNNAFVFSNREFRDSFYTNSAGLRDDELSLSHPDILCVGDSYTLGWGNDQHDNYPALIESMTGLRVLNVSMSSYGTAREVMKMDSLDLSGVRYIFWQYCFNDEEENNSYLLHGFSLPVHPERSFTNIVDIHIWTRKYFPGRHFFTMLKLGLRQLRRGENYVKKFYAVNENMKEQQQKAEHLLEILSNSPIDFSRTKMLVFDLSPYSIDRNFVVKLREVLQQEKFKKRFKGNLSVFDASSVLRRDDFYLLDVHIKGTGNEKLVRGLLKALPVN